VEKQLVSVNEDRYLLTEKMDEWKAACADGRKRWGGYVYIRSAKQRRKDRAAYKRLFEIGREPGGREYFKIHESEMRFFAMLADAGKADVDDATSGTVLAAALDKTVMHTAATFPFEGSAVYFGNVGTVCRLYDRAMGTTDIINVAYDYAPDVAKLLPVDASFCQNFIRLSIRVALERAYLPYIGLVDAIKQGGFTLIGNLPE
jgi:hypothetical protein